MQEVVHDRLADFAADVRASVGARTDESASPAFGVALRAVWRDAWLTFATHAAPMLLCALLSSAAVALVGAVAGLWLVGGSWTQRFNSIDLQRLPLLIAALPGLLTLTFARGIMTWMALRARVATPARRTAHAPLRWREAYQATLAQWPALLLGTLVYGVLMYAGILGLSQIAPDLRRDLTTPRYRNGTPETALRTLAARSLQAALPEPDAPFAQKLAWDRLLTRRRVVATPQTTNNTSNAATYQWVTAVPESTIGVSGITPGPALSLAGTTAFDSTPTQTQPFIALALPFRSVLESPFTALWASAGAAGVVGLAGLVVLVLAETLLRMRTVMAMRATTPARSVTRQEQHTSHARRGSQTRDSALTAARSQTGQEQRESYAVQPAGWLAPLMSSARFGLRHFAALTLHVWLLRGALWAASLFFILLPMELLHNWFAPALVRLGHLWVYTAVILVIPASLALVLMIFNAFSLVYDVCLYRYYSRE